MTEPQLPPQPSAEEIRAQADQFMQMLRDLKADGTPEAVRLRAALVETVDKFDNTPEGRAELVARMLGIESGIAELLMRTVEALRDRLYKEGKRIGTTSQAGKSIRAMSKALDTMAEALQQMVDAVATADNDLRKRAQVRMDEAKKQLQAVGMR